MKILSPCSSQLQELNLLFVGYVFLSSFYHSIRFDNQKFSGYMVNEEEIQTLMDILRTEFRTLKILRLNFGW